jgi:soluble lytic murein transglycosylase
MRSLIALFLLVLSFAAPAAKPAANLDDEFLAAREAYRAGQATRVAAYARRFKGHILEPYLAYWVLNPRLDQASAAEVRSFLGSYRDTPLSERLRSDWLKSLGKSQQWELFEEELPRVSNEDLELACYALQARMRVSPAETLKEARPLWFVGKDQPESCTPLFNALAANGLLSTEDLWTRVRLTLEAGQVGVARRAASYLPAGQAPEAGTLEAVFSNPAGHLEQKNLNFRNRAARETVMFAVHRLARTSAQQAARHWTNLEENFSAADRAYVWGMIAYLGAMRHDADALAWFSRAGDLSDLQLAWKARAALRVNNWHEVLAAIDAMTQAESSDGAWRYWKARALKALGRVPEADELLKPLAGEFTFYGQLALEELGGKFSVPATTWKPGPEDIRTMSQAPGIRRALELYRLNLRFDGNREWLYAIRGLDDRQLIAAAEVARRNDLYDRAINTADRTVGEHDFSLRYLAPYRDVLKEQTAQLNLDEAWVYGLIRQESRFIANAKSHAGASGLMQLMPATAQWVAKKLKLKDWRWSRVTEIDTNVSLGTWYLRHVLDSLDGQPVLASAAYNAGPGRARAWRPGVSIEGAAYAETIPFNETRDYVKKVMSNATYYAHALGQPVQPLRQRLNTIGPRLRDREPSLGDTP